MIRYLCVATALLAVPALAQTAAGGVVGGAAPAPYSPAGVPRAGTTPSGLGSAMTPGSAVVPALPQPSIGVTPPIGAASAGTIGDGRVGTLAGGATSPAVNGQPGMSTTSGVTSTTPTTNPPPQ
jgi:hypothetical protein